MVIQNPFLEPAMAPLHTATAFGGVPRNQAMLNARTSAPQIQHRGKGRSIGIYEQAGAIGLDGTGQPPFGKGNPTVLAHVRTEGHSLLLSSSDA